MSRRAVWILVVWLASLAPAAAQVQTGSIRVRTTDEQNAVMPGVAVTISSPVLVSGTLAGVTDASGVLPLPVPVSRNLHRADRAPGLPVGAARERRRHRRPDGAARARAAGGQRGRNGDGHRRLAHRRHDQRQRQRQPQRTAAAVHPGRPRHLGPGRVQGAQSHHHPSRRRRHVGRAAGHLHGARHRQHPEHPVPQRGQRRRSGGDRRRRLLLRLRRLRGYPGVDGRPRHHRAHRRRVPQHGHQERRQPLDRPRPLRLPAQRHPEQQRRRRDAALRVPRRHQLGGLRLGRQHQRRRPADSRQAAVLRVVPRLARARQRAGGVLGERARPDQHHLGPRQPHLPGQPEQQADGVLLLAEVRQAEPLPRQPDDAAGRGLHLQRAGHLPRVPDAVELDPHRPLLHRRALRVQQDQVPDLRQRHRADAARHRHQHPHPQLPGRYRAVPRPLPGQRHGAVLRRQPPGRPARAEVRLRPCARAGVRQDPQERRRRAVLQQRHRPERGGDALRHAVPHPHGGGRHRDLPAGQLRRQSHDPHRRPALGAARGLPARAGEPAVGVLPGPARAASPSSATW